MQRGGGGQAARMLPAWCAALPDSCAKHVIVTKTARSLLAQRVEGLEAREAIAEHAQAVQALTSRARYLPAAKSQGRKVVKYALPTSRVSRVSSMFRVQFFKPKMLAMA